MLFNRNYLFATMLTVIIVVCSLKSRGIPSFIVIGYCVSGICVPIVMYGDVRTTLHVCMMRVSGCYHFTKFHCSGF